MNPASARAFQTLDPTKLCLAVTEHAPLPMAAVEGATHILRYVNPAFCRMINRPAKQLVGRPLHQFLPKKNECGRLLDRVFRTGIPESFTERENSNAHPLLWSYTLWPLVADERRVGVMIQVTETAALHDNAVALNEALLLGSLRQHQLTETAENLNSQLRIEIAERNEIEEALGEARTRLAAHADQLEKLVAKRTAELTVTNRRLEASVKSIKQGHDKYCALFLQSEVMQKKLRQLTRQIIATQEEERKQISRELHDEVVQTLVGINVELSTVAQEVTASQPGLQEKIAYTRRLVENSVHAVHRFARGLRPAVLDDLGLIAALHAYCKSLAARQEFKIKLTACRSADTLGGAERTVLFRVAQEALTNVIRHAHASRVQITISRIPGAIRMEIADNGKSFAVEKNMRAENSKRLGLVGMRERVEMVGGSLTIDSAPGRGTRVRAAVPFKPSARK